MHSTSVDSVLSILGLFLLPIFPPDMSAPHMSHVSFWLDNSIQSLQSRRLNGVSGHSLTIDAHSLQNSLRIQANLLKFRLPILRPVNLGGRIFVAIMSRQESCKSREALRQSWLKEADSFRFFMGKGSPGEGCSYHPDEVTLSISESYRRMGEATRMMFDYVALNFADKFSYVVVADDDVFIRFRSLRNYIQYHGDRDYVLGSFVHDSFPVRNESDAKHFISYEAFPAQGAYPMYPRGFSYVVSMPLLRKFSDISSETPTPIPFGDVWVGLMLQRAASASSITVDDRIEDMVMRVPNCDREGSGIAEYIMVVHRVSPRQITCMFESDGIIQNQKVDLCSCVANH